MYGGCAKSYVVRHIVFNLFIGVKEGNSSFVYTCVCVGGRGVELCVYNCVCLHVP